MKKSVILCLLIFVVLFSCKNKQNYSFENNIIPKPSEVKFGKGELEIDNQIYLIINENCPEATKLKSYVMNFLGTCFVVDDVPEKQADGTNIFMSIAGEGDPESY